MASLFGSAAKDATGIGDQVIIENMLNSASAAAAAYLNATVASATPELRALYGAGLNQILEGHAAYTALAINKGWENPYNPPAEQLSTTYRESKTTVEIR